jgi:acetyltransferase-like isoleucine patch superfamily enzyme
MGAIKKLLRLKNYTAILRGLVLKLRHRSRVDFPLMHVYFGKGFQLNLTGSGTLKIDAGSGDDRVYFDRQCSISISNGNVSIGRGAFFNENCRISSHFLVEIGRDCLFGPNVSIYDADHVFSRPDVPIRYQGYKTGAIKIMDNCWAGANSVFLRGAVLPKGSVVAANSSFNSVAAEPGVYAGNPGKLIKNLP